MDLKNKMIKTKINILCDEIECVLRVIARANDSGDNAEKEVDAGITLTSGLVSEIKGIIEST